MKLTCQYESGTGVLHFDDREVVVSCDHPDHRPPKVFDFALFAAAAIGMQRSVDIELDLPVSRCAMNNLDEILSAYQCWCFGRIRRPEIAASSIIEDDALGADGPFRGLFLSGGVDSMESLISRRHTNGLTHGVLVHGIDYMPSDGPGFDALRSHVAGICENTGLTLITIKTDIRTSGDFGFEIFNTLTMAMCAHFLGERFRSIAFSADNNMYQEYIMLPYSNSFLCNRLSGGNLRIEYRGFELTRFEKLAAIVADGRFVNSLRVCWADRSSERNCGICGKCLHTRAGLEILGVDTTELFDDRPDLVAALKALSPPRTVFHSENFFLRFQEIHDACPPGELKDTIAHLAQIGFDAARLEAYPIRKYPRLAMFLWRMANAVSASRT